MPRVKSRPVMIRKNGHASARGGNGGGGGSEGDGFSPFQEGARLAVWIFLVSLTMMFAALSVVYLARLPDKPKFPFEPPPILWLNTAVLLLSSGTCQSALHAIRRGDPARLIRWLGATLFLGLLFLVGQFYGWHQLLQKGFHLQKHFFSGFFYLLTGAHAFHLLSGVLLLGYVWLRARLRTYTAENHLPVALITLYWHFLDLLWLWLFILLKLL